MPGREKPKATERPAARTSSAHTAPLERRLGLLQATALNMSNMIGVGPFITIPGLMAAMGGPQAILGWVAALVIALADGLIWSEFGSGDARFRRELMSTCAKLSGAESVGAVCGISLHLAISVKRPA